MTHTWTAVSIMVEAEESGKGAALNLDIQWDCTETTNLPCESDLLGWACAALPGGGAAVGLTIRVVDESEMQAANNEWRHKNTPTNVLSFPANFPPEAGIEYLGDMLICADVIFEESVQQDKPLYAHWAHIVVHGMLHLQGFDHVDEQGAVEMEAREVEILAALGYNNPYESPLLESGIN